MAWPREFYVHLIPPVHKRLTKADAAAMMIAGLFTYTRREFAAEAARAVVKRLGVGWRYTLRRAPDYVPASEALPARFKAALLKERIER